MFKLIGEYDGATIDGGKFETYEEAYYQYMTNGMSGGKIAAVKWKIVDEKEEDIKKQANPFLD